MADRASIENKVRVSELLRLYGQLLSEHQRRYLTLYYDEDLSLAEIGRGSGISRQAVHDALRQGRAGLEEYERVLGLYERQRSAQDPARLAEVKRLLGQLRRMAQAPVIYDTQPIRRTIQEIEEGLNAI